MPATSQAPPTDGSAHAPAIKPAQEHAHGQVVTPWDVEGAVTDDGKQLAIDYDKLVDQFGTRRVDAAVLERFERLTGQRPHIFLRRGMFFSHRYVRTFIVHFGTLIGTDSDFDKILDRYEQGKPWFLYTGRGPSSDSMHLGHMVPFVFTKCVASQPPCDTVLRVAEMVAGRLRRTPGRTAYRCVPRHPDPQYFLTVHIDDEKFLFKHELKPEQTYEFARRNARDIIAVGFDVKKTFIFSDYDYVGGAFYRNVSKISRQITINQAKATFGFNDS